jgi:23S rRNA (cytidine1920-2'-O)/16S rRNA (cytidine1409-2'-O)-methyltransferase
MTMAQAKERLDKLLLDRGLAESRAKAQAYIMAGEVNVNGQRVDKPGTAVALDAVIELATPMPYVSRGGYKLAGALDELSLDVNGMICADVGACTGGFTDVLLQRGAARVYAIDVGQGQLDWKLRQDSRVVVMERTNARYLESLPESIDFVTIDVSFISLKLILPQVGRWLRPDGRVLALIKPQFEAGPESVGKGGIVRDAKVRRQVLTDLLTWATKNAWSVGGLTRSSIKGTDGNVEYLTFLQCGGNKLTDITSLIDSVSNE